MLSSLFDVLHEIRQIMSRVASASNCIRSESQTAFGNCTANPRVSRPQNASTLRVRSLLYSKDLFRQVYHLMARKRLSQGRPQEAFNILNTQSQRGELMYKKEFLLACMNTYKLVNKVLYQCNENVFLPWSKETTPSHRHEELGICKCYKLYYGAQHTTVFKRANGRVMWKVEQNAACVKFLTCTNCFLTFRMDVYNIDDIGFVVSTSRWKIVGIERTDWIRTTFTWDEWHWVTHGRDRPNSRLQDLAEIYENAGVNNGLRSTTRPIFGLLQCNSTLKDMVVEIHADFINQRAEKDRNEKYNLECAYGEREPWMKEWTRCNAFRELWVSDTECKVEVDKKEFSTRWMP